MADTGGGVVLSRISSEPMSPAAAGAKHIAAASVKLDLSGLDSPGATSAGERTPGGRKRSRARLSTAAHRSKAGLLPTNDLTSSVRPISASIPRLAT